MIKLKDLLEDTSTNHFISILFESPLRIDFVNVDELTNTTTNIAYTLKVKESVKIPINKFLEYDIYQFKNGKYITDIFTKDNYTVCCFIYEIDKDTFLERKVWQDSLKTGLCRNVILEYYLHQYTTIISDGLHTDLGKKYWEKLMDESLKLGYNCYVITNQGNIKIQNPLEELDNYYNSVNNKFVIQRV